MSRWIESGAAAASSAALGCCLLLALAGCGTAATARSGHDAPARAEDKTVLERGRLPNGPRWQLVAFMQGRQLGLDLESPSGYSYSGQVSFAANRDYSYYWGEGLGPGNSVFYYGPLPEAAVMVRLSSPGHRPVLVRTAPLPNGHSLPHGRFFVVRPPGTSTLSWAVTPLDAAGQKVAFTAF
jgi:hypothetical protein